MNGRKLLAGAAVLALAGVCVSSAVRDETLAPQPIVDYGPVRLVAFDSCDNALTELRNAMAPYVSAYGLGGNARIMTAEGMATNNAGVAQKSMPDTPTAATPPAQQQDHSTTNVHEQGVDEPDIVKTDGKRVVSIADGKLRVIDVASRTVTGTVDLGDRYANQLLVSGDRALVVANSPVPIMEKRVPDRPSFAPESGTELILVDLKALKQISSLKTDGFYLDARQIGGTARVVADRHRACPGCTRTTRSTKRDRCAATGRSCRASRSPRGCRATSWTRTAPGAAEPWSTARTSAILPCTPPRRC